MNFYVDPNMRHRVRSNLGRRNKNGDKPSQPFTNSQPLIISEPPKTILTGLGRSKSAKKSAYLDRASKYYMAGKTKKQLFQISPGAEEILGVQEQRLFGTKLDFNSSTTSSNNSSMDITGIKVIGTPSPRPTDHRVTALSTKSNNSETQHCEDFSSKIYSFDPDKFLTASRRLSIAERVSANSRLEPPRSPGPSLYDELIRKELADIKPPVDRTEELQLERLSLQNGHVMSASPPALGIATSTLIKHPPSSSKQVKKLDVINEDFDSTDSFEMAEKTILDNCLENSLVNNNPTRLITNGSFLESNNRSDMDEVLETILEEMGQKLEEMGQRRKEIEERLHEMSRLEQEMTSLKIRLQCYHKNQHTQQLKNNTIVKNKENISVNNIENVKNNKWINSLKTENPGLLKTPKPNKPRPSFADHSAIWTPHSLSLVLHDQVKDLFS